MGRRLALLLSTGALLVGGCGSDQSAVGGETGFQPGDVTPVVLQVADGPVELAPWTYCLGNGCADGRPPKDLAAVGSPAEVPFTFARDGWTFDATFREHDSDCPRMITVAVEKTGPREFVIRPAGLAGDWDVDVFGRGDGGDVITTFRWRTPVDGEMPPPASGSAAVLADHEGELDSYGVELGVDNLASRPGRATAAITVSGSDGQTTIEPRWVSGCYSQGDLWFKAARSRGLAATEIGEGPFTYTVTLTLDGTTYTGIGEWPTEESPGTAPHVPLTWTPALPSYVG